MKWVEFTYAAPTMFAASVWYQSARVITVLSNKRSKAIESHNYVDLTIINIVQVLVGIVGIIDNQWAAKTVTVLSSEVAMVPIGS